MYAKRREVFTEDDFTALERILSDTTNSQELCSKIVNLPFDYPLKVTKLSLGIIVLLSVNNSLKLIEKLAVSDNELAESARKMSSKKLDDLRIPLSCKENLIVKAIKTNRIRTTIDWKCMLIPELSAEEARFVQASGAIGFTGISPFKVDVPGVLIFCFYQYQENIGPEQYNFIRSYTKLASKYLNKKNR